MSSTRLIYVFDAYCGWCFGFGPALREFAMAHAGQVEVEVVSGGLFVGQHLAPLGSMPHVAAANERIAQLTGARFGDGYRRLVEDGSFVMDSGAAAVGFAALRAEAPAHTMLELAGAMQQAFYVDGLSLSDPQTYIRLSRAHHHDDAAVVGRLGTAVTDAAAKDDLQRSRSLGVSSFPTLLVQTPTGTARLGGPTSSATQLAAALDQHRRSAGVGP
jgi:putative protein-disulfide isomerase